MAVKRGYVTGDAGSCYSPGLFAELHVSLLLWFLYYAICRYPRVVIGSLFYHQSNRGLPLTGTAKTNSTRLAFEVRGTNYYDLKKR